MPRNPGSLAGSESGDQQAEIWRNGARGKGNSKMNKGVPRRGNGKGKKIFFSSTLDFSWGQIYVRMFIFKTLMKVFQYILFMNLCICVYIHLYTFVCMHMYMHTCTQYLIYGLCLHLSKVKDNGMHTSELTPIPVSCYIILLRIMRCVLQEDRQDIVTCF